MASMVTTGGILADIGTDHAYVPIALVQRQKIKGFGRGRGTASK